MLTDISRSISIYYDYRNQPYTIQVGFNYINNVYDATGNRVVKRSTYLEGEDGEAGEYSYYLLDHLGSTRVVVKEVGAVRKAYDYFPFGLSLREVVYDNDRTRFRFTGKERDEGSEYDNFGVRDYYAAIGRWMIPDRFADMYPSLTPYHYAANNPAIFIDINGDSIAYFDNNTGVFSKFVDDGKKEWSGQTITYDKNGNVIVHNSFTFNDPKTNIQAIKNGTINRVGFINDSYIDAKMEQSTVTDNKGAMGKYFFAKNEATGSMDYGVKGILNGELATNSFYIVEGSAYDVGDFGNFLWGHGMSELGIPLSLARCGAHFNNAVNGRTQMTSLYNFGPGTYGKPGLLDSPADQRAIVAGYKYLIKGGGGW
jgi:RHS repeat-associated protein